MENKQKNKGTNPCPPNTPPNSKHEPYAYWPTTSKTTPTQASTRTCRNIGERLGIGPETLRKWHKQAQIDAGSTPGTTTDMAAENRRLRKENAELKRTNEILRTASA
ncbi:transposase [Rothia amarae]|uniref:transposase n=1 Tax=Rothia amarae TaxID=169480 RepID=UPI0012447DE5